MKESQPLLKVEHLKKYYDVKGGIIKHTIAQVKAVDDVSFSIPRGRTLGLVGESGCGKSTIGRQIVRLEKPTEGKIYYKSIDIAQLTEQEMHSYRTKLQMVFQDSYSSLNPRKRIEDIIAEPMLYHGLIQPKDVYGSVRHLLAEVGLPQNSMGRFPHEFSGGQRQRICIAKALSLNPEMIVCDEPVSALDVSIQAQILNLLRELQKRLNLTILFIGHGLGAVNYVSDSIAVMYLGRLVEVADASELFAHPVHPYTQALCAAIPSIDPRDRVREEQLLQGEVIHSPKNLGDIQGGCLFASRCQYSSEKCNTISMNLEPIKEGSNHMSACPFSNHAYAQGQKLKSVNGGKEA